MNMFKIIFGALILMVSGAIEAGAIDQSICSPGANMVFYPNGSLQSCVLKDSYSANGIKCNSQHPASFYDNGRLETCILAESATLGAQQCKEGPISFYQDGKFRSCVKKD